MAARPSKSGEPAEEEAAGGDLAAAAMWGDKELLESLLRGGADPDFPNLQGNSALHEAAYYGELECASILLDHKGTGERECVCVSVHVLSVCVCVRERVWCVVSCAGLVQALVTKAVAMPNWRCVCVRVSECVLRDKMTVFVHFVYVCISELQPQWMQATHTHTHTHTHIHIPIHTLCNCLCFSFQKNRACYTQLAS